MFQQISKFMEPFLSKYQCGFRKGYNTQYCLLAMLEKWKSSVDKGSSFGAFLTDLSKAFDCLSHELLIAKLRAYGFSLNALRLVHSYLTNRKQRIKLILNIALGRRYYSQYLKHLSHDFFFLIFFFVTYSS